MNLSNLCQNMTFHHSKTLQCFPISLNKTQALTIVSGHSQDQTFLLKPSLSIPLSSWMCQACLLFVIHFLHLEGSSPQRVTWLTLLCPHHTFSMNFRKFYVSYWDMKDNFLGSRKQSWRTFSCDSHGKPQVLPRKISRQRDYLRMALPPLLPLNDSFPHSGSF